jgi:predicted phage terminase large subunit-like protein
METTINPELKKLQDAIIEKHELYMAMLKEKAGKSLYLFNKYILEAEKGDENFVPLGSFHREVCNFIQDRLDKRKLVLIPRSHLKTKLLSVGYPTFKIIQNPKIRILIYSATWQMAVDIHQAIQKNLKGSSKIIDIWGDFAKDAPVWSQSHTRLRENDKREPTITAAGIDNNLVGGHYDLILMDDVVNRDNVGTMDQIGKVITRYKDCLDLLEPKGELIVIGTRWHDSDLYGWILDPSNNAMDNYLTMVRRAYEGNIMTGDDFVALWPGKFDRHGLMNKLREEGWGHFSSQYLNDPVPEEDATFKKTWFKYYTSDDIRGKILNKFLLIDPAISLAKDADYTAMVVIGVDEYNNIFILDIARARMSPNEIINQIFRLRDNWNLSEVCIEQVAFQRVIGYALREDSRFKMRPLRITELKPNDRSKDQRIKGLQPSYENGKIFHNKTLANNIYLEDELVRFPRSSHDDVIDALAYFPDVVYPARQPTSGRNKQRKYLYR